MILNANCRILENLEKNRIQSLPILLPLEVSNNYYSSVYSMNIYFCNKWLFCLPDSSDQLCLSCKWQRLSEHHNLLIVNLISASQIL